MATILLYKAYNANEKSLKYHDIMVGYFSTLIYWYF